MYLPDTVRSLFDSRSISRLRIFIKLLSLMATDVVTPHMCVLGENRVRRCDVYTICEVFYDYGFVKRFLSLVVADGVAPKMCVLKVKRCMEASRCLAQVAGADSNIILSSTGIQTS